MIKKQPINVAVAWKISAIIIMTLGLMLMSLCWALYSTGNSTARRLASYLQSGTQIYFDEGRAVQEVYGAKVTAYDAGRQLLFEGQNYVRGSSLPDNDKTGQYPIVANASFRFRRGNYFGVMTNEVYQSKITPALILNPGTDGFEEAQGMAVLTVNANIGPLAGKNYGLRLATYVHVQPGFSRELRGSSVSLTIAPEQAQSFFESKIGKAGTIHIHR